MPQELENWTDIHPDFTPELTTEWKRWEFSDWECQKWVQAGLKPQESQFARWLEIENYVSNKRRRMQGREIVFNPNQKAQLQAQYINEWGDLHPDFAKKPQNKTYQRLWTEQGFNKEQAQQYLENGFAIKNYMFLTWLRDNQQLVIKQLSKEEIEQLRAVYHQTWAELDAQFARKWLGKIYQQHWEESGLSYEQAQSWIKLGSLHSSNHFCWPQQWMKRGFNLDTAQSWLTAGLKEDEFEIASYLRANNYTLQNWRKKSHAQHWLDCFYPAEGTSLRKDWRGDKHRDYGKTRQEITELDISGQKLTGELDLSGFTNLKWLDCSHNQINNLILLPNNQLKTLELITIFSPLLTEQRLILPF